MLVKKGDTVLVITGKDKGKTGKVMEVNPAAGKVLVDGVNVVTKHQKPKSAQDKGGIVKKTAPIDVSNVMVVCPTCGKATRVAHTMVGEEKVRACKKCNASLDKKFVKQAKKEAKKVEKTEKTAVETVKPEVKAEAKKAPAKTATKTQAKPAAAKTTTAKKSTATKKVESK